MAPHSSIVARKIPWREEPGGLQSMGSLRVRHDWATSLSLSTFMHWRRKWQPTPVFLPGESHGWRSLVGCRVGHDWSDLAAAANSRMALRINRVQSKLPPNMPLWPIDYFELKLFEKQLVQEWCSDTPLSLLKAENKSHIWKVLCLHEEGERQPYPRDKEFRIKKTM